MNTLLILATVVTRFISIYAFVSLVGIVIGITSSAIGLKICVIIPGIKKYKSVIKRKKKKHDKRVLLAKTMLNSIEVLLSKDLIDLNSSHYEFVSINNVLKEYNDTRKKSKVWRLQHSVNYLKLFIKTMLSYCMKYRKNTEKPEASKDKKKENQCFYQNVQCVVVKNWDLSVNKLLIARDKFMPEMNLRQSGFTHSTCGSFTKNR